MKINPNYLKKLLIAFEDSEGPDVWVKDLHESGFDRNSEDFIFHMRILDDNNLICRIDMKSGFGYEIAREIGPHRYEWYDIPIRLTARGHDFIADLRQREVWNTVSDNFKEASISTLLDITKKLAQGFAKQKIKNLTGLDIE